jgi:hypothetical protein
MTKASPLTDRLHRSWVVRHDGPSYAPIPYQVIAAICDTKADAEAAVDALRQRGKPGVTITPPAKRRRTTSPHPTDTQTAGEITSPAVVLCALVSRS